MFSRLTGLVSALLIIVGALNSAEVLAIVSPEVAKLITIGATVVLSLSRALVDTDNDGVPDLFEALRDFFRASGR